MKIDQRMRPTPHQVARGFTLLELVVVVGILVILAGFVLPKIDVFKLKANKGVAAANMTSVSRVIQQYYAQNAVYPDRWDSLLLGTALWAPGVPGGAQGIDPQLVGGPPDASPTKLTVATIATDEELRSLNRIGITTVFDANAAGDGVPNSHFTAQRALAVGGSVATINPADEDGQAIIAHIYPGSVDTSTPPVPVVPDGKKLVVFGIGGNSNMIGTVLQEVPLYSNTDATQYYSHFLAIFQLSEGGSRAELKAVVGADGDLITEEINDYYER